MAARVRAHLGQDHRYEHSVRVARLAELLAARHGASTYKARIAGMLHDLARLYPPKRLLEEAGARNMPVDAYAREHPTVLHAALGAALAREQFGVDDPEVLSAIAKHTLADGRMSVLDCIVYLADSLEPGRTFADRAALEALAFEDLKKAMAATLNSSFGFLREKGLAAAPQSLEAASTFGLRADPGR